MKSIRNASQSLANISLNVIGCNLLLHVDLSGNLLLYYIWKLFQSLRAQTIVRMVAMLALRPSVIRNSINNILHSNYTYEYVRSYHFDASNSFRMRIFRGKADTYPLICRQEKNNTPQTSKNSKEIKLECGSKFDVGIIIMVIIAIPASTERPLHRETIVRIILQHEIRGECCIFVGHRDF